jgi:hypothetical protein
MEPEYVLYNIRKSPSLLLSWANCLVAICI